jgi:G2/mitotic-specific cyclin 2
MEQPSIMQIL